MALDPLGVKGLALGLRWAVDDLLAGEGDKDKLSDR